MEKDLKSRDIPSRNFKLANLDTDSIMFCKHDETPFNLDEIIRYTEELNSLFPPTIVFEDDGYYPNVLVLKAKNYALWDGKKIKIKGSALRDTKREKALREFISEITDDLLFGKNNLQNIYLKYVKEAMNVTDINRWAFKKTITASVLHPERTNEQKVLDALKGTEYSEGDKRWFFFREDETLCLVEQFDGCYDRLRLVEKVYKTLSIFDSVIDLTQFTKFHLKKNRGLLEELCKL